MLDAHRFRILNVSPDAAARSAITRTLGEAGHPVREAASGVEALLRVADDRPRVVVLDVDLPDASGYEICRRIKAEGIAVVLTAATFEGAGGGEADAYLVRPFERVQLVSSVQALLRLQQAEGELRERAEQLAAADRRRDEMLAMLAHELRNPLAAILAAGALLERFPAHDRKETWGRDVIKRQALHMDRLAGDLLDASRATRGLVELRRERVDLVRVVEGVAALVREKLAGRTFEVRLPDSPVFVSGDPVRLEQVIGNLLDNGRKFTEPGGHVTLELRTAGDRAIVRVADDGVGIAPEQLATVFDTFVQGEVELARSKGGLGIGLSLVRRLVELHGGSVTARSDGRGRGAAFEVVLPRLVARAANDSSEHVPAQRRGVRMLVVEDNADIREALREVCASWGHQVHVAADGRSAIELAQRIQPEVALVDLGLPGVDGYEIARRLRAGPAGANIHLLAITGYGAPEYEQRSLAAGFDAHLVKPVDPEQLRRLVAAGRRAAALTG